jgi:integrase
LLYILKYLRLSWSKPVTDLETFENFLRKPSLRTRRFDKKRKKRVEGSTSDEAIRQNIYRAKRLLDFQSPITYESVESFRNYLKELGRKDEYCNKFVTVARLWGHCFENKELLDLEYVRVTDADPKIILSLDELKRIINCPPPKKQWAKQHEMMSLYFACLAVTGARPGEIAKLTVDRVSWGMNAFILDPKNVKTREPRLVPITANLGQQLKDRIKIVLQEKKSPVLFKTHTEYRLFYTQGGKLLRKNEWNRNLKSRLDYLGIPKLRGLSAKSFRDGYITEMLQTEGVNLFDVMYQVGHSTPLITQKYYKYTMRRKQQVANMHPLAREHVDAGQRVEQFREALMKLFIVFKGLPEADEVRMAIKKLDWY